MSTYLQRQKVIDDPIDKTPERRSKSRVFLMVSEPTHALRWVRLLGSAQDVATDLQIGLPSAGEPAGGYDVLLIDVAASRGGALAWGVGLAARNPSAEVLLFCEDDADARSGDPAQPRSVVAAATGCLSPDDCFSYLEGWPDAPPVARTHRHLDECEACRMMMAEAVRAAHNAEPIAPVRGFRTLNDGERVGGRYEILRFVARGGMGEVYEAVDTVLHERVALKTLAVTASDQGDSAERLLREVRIARKVTHPNVCRILELGIHRRSQPASDAVPFLTMDFLTGETLAKRLSRCGRLPPTDVLRLFRDLAAGLGAVHQAGIVHRDLKSDNVFLVRNDDGTERTVVMDFGLAQVFEGSSARGSSNGRLMIGTPAYMAPEQLTGQPATPATDVYALGIVTFEMLTGRLPFSGDTLAAVALSRLHQAAPAPSSLVEHVGRGWDSVLERCLERDPKRRFASINEVTAAVDRIGRGESPKRGIKWSVLGGLGGLAVAAVFAVGVVSHRGVDSDAQPTNEDSACVAIRGGAEAQPRPHPVPQPPAAIASVPDADPLAAPGPLRPKHGSTGSRMRQESSSNRCPQ